MYGTMVVEGALFLIGAAVYARVTRPIDRIGRWSFGALVALLAVLYVANAYGPPPTNISAVAWGALAGWLLPLFGWWIDRHRTAT